ncbi:hypothetical protein FO519_003937 [Halicephalobus sp. NKZ332]|nr:hypothetical protein FO519_003937 [Halicephalobus sp. NKZ332]
MKKQIAILSNYFYPDIYGHLEGAMMDGMNTTFVSLFVLNGSFIPPGDLEKSKIPIQVFDKSSPNFNYTEASELYLNQYIDYDYDSYSPTVRMFAELKDENLDLLGFFINIFDISLCQLSNITDYYQFSLLVHYSNYQAELLLPIPNLGSYTMDYFRFLFPLLLIANTHHQPTDHLCKENFYSRFVDWITQDQDFEQFNFYLIDDYPTCMITAMSSAGVMANSLENHLEVYIYSSKKNIIDEEEIFEQVTSVIFSPENATLRASHVFVGDFKNRSFVNSLRPCQQETDSVELLPPERFSDHKSQSDWLTIGIILISYVAFSLITMFILSELSYIRSFKTFLTRRTTRISSTNLSKYRITESITSTSKIMTEITHQNLTQFDNWRIPASGISINFTNILGRGSSATIYKAFLSTKSPLSENIPRLETQHFTKCHVAVKASLCYNFMDSDQINKEIEVMKVLEYHPNICGFLGWTMARELPCLVFELVESDLLKWSKSFRETHSKMPPIKDIYKILWQIANGMIHISMKKLVHRDLAARNVLLTPDLRVKITDFGLCCNCDQSYTYAGSVTKKLPIKWLSPEAILDRLFSEKSEMMLKCWETSPDDRPTFVNLRTEFTSILESEAFNYGYLEWVSDPKSPGGDTVFSGYEFPVGPEIHENQEKQENLKDFFDWDSEDTVTV